MKEKGNSSKPQKKNLNQIVVTMYSSAKLVSI